MFRASAEIERKIAIASMVVKRFPWRWRMRSSSPPWVVVSSRICLRIEALASEFWSKGGVTFYGFDAAGKGDQSGDPQVDGMIEKARVEQDAERRRALVYDIQRYLAKPWYSAVLPGYATGLVPAWPCLANYRVWQGGRYASYRWWIDETKPPFKSA